MIKKLFILFAVCVACTSAMAQGFGGRGNNPAFLLRRNDVKADPTLALTDDEKNKIAEISTSYNGKFQDARQNSDGDREAMRKTMGDLMKSLTDEINKVLTADQQKRLKEIQYQISGASAIPNDKDLQTALGLTDGEKSKIEALSKQGQDANMAVFQKMQSQEISREDATAAFTKNGEALKSGIEAILSEAEKAKFKELQGKPFTITDKPGGGFGRGQ